MVQKTEINNLILQMFVYFGIFFDFIAISGIFEIFLHFDMFFLIKADHTL